MVPDLILLLCVLVHASLILFGIIVGAALLLFASFILGFLVILWMLAYDLYRLLCWVVHYMNNIASSLFWLVLFVVSWVFRIVMGSVGIVTGCVHSVISEYGLWTDYSNCSDE